MRVRVAAVAVALFVSTLAVPRASDVARAEDAIDAEAIVSKFVESLKAKKISAAIAIMNPDVVDAIGSKPAEAARLARTIADRVIETCAAEPKNAPAVAEIAMRVAKKASAVCPGAGAPAAPAPTPKPAAPAGGDAPAAPAAPPEGEPAPAAPAAPAADSGGADNAARALAFAKLAVAATKAILGDPVKPDEWAAAMADAKKIGAIDATGEEDLGLAVETVLYAIDDEAPDEAALRGAADVVAFGRQKFPNSTSIADVGLRTEIAFACGLSITKPAEAKKELPKVLAKLNGFPDKDSDKQKVGAWNLCVAALRRLSAAGTFTFKSESQTSPNGWFAFDWPKESGWEQDSGTSEDEIFRLVRKGPRSTYSLRLREWKWHTNYYTDDVHSIDGENKAGLSKFDHDTAVKTMSKVSKDQPNLKGKLSAQITDSNGFDVRGLDENGKPVRFRGWSFYGTKNKSTFSLTLTQIGAVKEKDPQLDFVIDSIREPGAEKKK